MASKRSFLGDVYFESFVTLFFSVALTSVWGVSDILRQEVFPTAEKDQLIGALLVGWLTFFGVFFGTAVVNPAVGLMLLVQKKLSVSRYLVFAVVQVVITLLGVLVVAATYESYPAVFKGVAPPGPPPSAASRAHVFLSEFAVTFSVLFVGGLCGKYAGRVPGAFLGSVFYWVVAYYEAGAFSGAIMNPASILALHIYDKDLGKPSAWLEVAPKVAPYAAGSAAAAVLLGVVERVRGGAAGGKKRAAAAGGGKAMSAAATERRAATRPRAQKAE